MHLLRRIVASLLPLGVCCGAAVAQAPVEKRAGSSEPAAVEADGEKRAVQPPDPGGLNVFPAIAYAPETSLLLGAVGMYRFDAGDNARRRDATTGARPRKSVVTLFSAYTLRNQLIVASRPSVYLDGERWLLSGNASFTLFPDRFYALGQRSANRFERYEQRAITLSVGVERRLWRQLRAGAASRVVVARPTELEPDGLLDSGAIAGSDGGRIVGAGPVLAWDDRDRDTATHSGGRHEVALLAYPGAFGSQYVYRQATLRLRQFFALWRQHVLALELIGVLSDGDVPFQQMGKLGGDEHMRGFYEGRFRERNQLSGQLAYRLPIWWRFGAVAFVGGGHVSRALSDIRLAETRVAGGVGLRYSLSPKERVNLRFDTAVNDEGEVKFYVNLGEAF